MDRVVVEADAPMHPVADGLHQGPAGRHPREGAPGQLHQGGRIAIGAGVQEAVGVDRQSLDGAGAHRGQHGIAAVWAEDRGGVVEAGGAGASQQATPAVAALVGQHLIGAIGVQLQALRSHQIWHQADVGMHQGQQGGGRLAAKVELAADAQMHEREGRGGVS